MEPRRKTADSFGTFLEALQDKSNVAPTPDEAVLRLLTALDGSGPVAVADLWPRTGLDIVVYVEAMKTAKEGGFAVSSGSGDAERVEITDSGAKVAALARTNDP